MNEGLICKTKTFNRWMLKHKVDDAVLLKAVEEMKRGLIDADLGGNLYKKRVALPGRGKRGGARTLKISRTICFPLPAMKLKP